MKSVSLTSFIHNEILKEVNLAHVISNLLLLRFLWPTTTPLSNNRDGFLPSHICVGGLSFLVPKSFQSTFMHHC